MAINKITKDGETGFQKESNSAIFLLAKDAIFKNTFTLELLLCDKQRWEKLKRVFFIYSRTFFKYLLIC